MKPEPEVLRAISKKYDGMMGRCYRSSDPSYKNYGAKGIKVCSIWIKDINAFKTWFINLLKKDGNLDVFSKNTKIFQLDRINTNGNYTPENCQIVSPQENSRNQNRRKRRIITSAEGEKILY